MTKPMKHVAVGTLAAVALATTAFVVFAQTETAAPAPAPDGFLAKVAANLGVSVDDLTAALTKARLAMIDEAVALGRITAEQAQAMKERIAARDALRDALSQAIEDGTLTRDQLALLRRPDRGGGELPMCRECLGRRFGGRDRR